MALILAHVIAVFLLQNRKDVTEKNRGDSRNRLLHFAGYFTALAFFTHPYFSLVTAALWIALPAAHLLVDWLKYHFFSSDHPAAVLIFLLDQALHLLLIFYAWQWANPPLCQPVLSFYQRLLTPAGRSLIRSLAGTGLSSVLLVTIVYLFVIFGGAVLVRQVLDSETLRLPGPIENIGDTRRAGRYIGMLERAIILSLTLARAFTAIAFVLTAKSIARHRELENREFAEYYLIGTLLSALLAILGGLLLKFILSGSVAIFSTSGAQSFFH